MLSMVGTSPYQPGRLRKDDVEHPGSCVRRQEIAPEIPPLLERPGHRIELPGHVVGREDLEQQLEEHAHAADRRQRQERQALGVRRHDDAAERTKRRALGELVPGEPFDQPVLVAAADRFCQDTLGHTPQPFNGITVFGS